MNRQEYIERAKAEVERARERLPGYAGACSVCRWSRQGILDLHEVCEHPAVVCASFNISDAYDQKRIQRCEEQRDKSSIHGPVLCGPDGALFEKRASWWSMFFG